MVARFSNARDGGGKVATAREGVQIRGAMRTSRLALLLISLSPLSACGGGPEILAGGENTVSIVAGPLSNVDALAQNYCRRYRKRAVLIGAGPLGPSTVKRLYAYDCVDSNHPQ